MNGTTVPFSNLAFRAAVRRIVDGQVRSFHNDHPTVIPEKWLDSIAKRITNDLTSDQQIARFRTLLGGT